MTKSIEHEETVHVKAEDFLPATSASSPEMEMLKIILDQLVENERKRVRNEFIRLMFLILITFLILLTGGFWLAQNILQKLQDERLHAEQSWNNMIQYLPEYTNASRLMKVPVKSKQSRIQNITQRKTAQKETSDEVQHVIFELKGKNKVLSELVRTQNENIKSLILEMLNKRNKDIQELHAGINEKNTTMTTREIPEQKHSERSISPVANTVKNTAGNSLIIPAQGDIPLRVPIPMP